MTRARWLCSVLLLLLVTGLLGQSRAEVIVWPGPGSGAAQGPGGGVSVTDSPLTWTGLNTWQRSGGLTGHFMRYSSIKEEVGSTTIGIAGVQFDKPSTDITNSNGVLWSINNITKWFMGLDVQTSGTEPDMVLLWDQTYGASRTGTDVWRISPHAGTTNGLKVWLGDSTNSPSTNIALFRLSPSASNKHTLQLDTINQNHFNLLLTNTGGSNFRTAIVFGTYNTGTNVLTQKWWLANDRGNNQSQNFFLYDAVAGAERFTVNSTGNFVLGSGDAASGATGNTFRGPSKTGTNAVGVQTTLQGALGTSTGAPGRIDITGGALNATSGTTAHTAVPRHAFGASKVLTNNSTISLVNATLANGSVHASHYIYAGEVTDGTDYQIEEGYIVCHVTNKAGTIANNTCVKSTNQQSMTSGSLAVTFAISAANPAVISVNANSSLTPSSGYPRIVYEAANLTQQAFAIQ